MDPNTKARENEVSWRKLGDLDFADRCLLSHKNQHMQEKLVALQSASTRVGPGVIIGDGDRKRAPFLVLGLSPWYGTIILFLDQIAPSPAAHARTCCEDFSGYRAGEMASEISEILKLNAFTSVGILLKYFLVSYSSLSEVRQCRIYVCSAVSLYISLTKLCSDGCFFLRQLYIIPL